MIELEFGEGLTRDSGNVASRLQLDGIDLLKFLLSMVIVAIHSSLLGPWRTSPIYPWARIAVPVFFIISAYFFFSKYQEGDVQYKHERLRRFVRRNLTLYVAWLVILLIPTVMSKGYLSRGAFGLLVFVRDFFFGSTFPASWFITATVFAVVLVVLADRYLSNKTILAITFVAYLVACGTSSYWYLVIANPGTKMIFTTIRALMPYPYCSFIVALFWVQLGKCLAEGEFKKLSPGNRKNAGWLLATGCGLLLAEYWLVRWFGWARANDCYLFLALPAIALFCLARDSAITLPNAPWCRAASTVTYCLHLTLLNAIGGLASQYSAFAMPSVKMIVVLGICWLTTSALMGLDRLGVPFSKYLH